MVIRIVSLMRRKIIISISIIISLSLLVTCEEETSVPREYPRLTGVLVSNISTEGAVFEADLYSLGNSELLEYGFLWGKSKSLSLEIDERIYLGKPDKTGTFTAEVRTALAEGKVYYVRPFVITKEKKIYGPVTEFKSLGSQGPAITGFSPDAGAWDDTLTIFGKNFSWVENEVFLNDKRIAVVKVCDTVIRAIVEASVTALENNVSVTVAGTRVTFPSKKFMLIPPSITDFSPKEAMWGDTITIKGRHLRQVLTLGSYVKLGNVNCLALSPILSDSVFTFRVPYEVTTVSNQLSLKVNGFLLSGSSPLKLLPPSFSFTPAEGTWGNKVTLKGRFNTIAGRNTFYFNSSSAIITSQSGSSVTIIVPEWLADSLSNIKYNVLPFSVISPDKFRLLPPRIDTFSPTAGMGGTSVTIKGRYFSTVTTTVKFDSLAATVISKNDSVIVVKAPAGANGHVKISVKSFQQETVSAGDFNLTNPSISGFSPATGTFDDLITITGENFIPGSTSVSFGNYSATVVSSTPNEIVAKVPLTLDSIPSTIKVTAGGNLTTSAGKFTLTPPVVTSFSPASYTPGGDIVISGQYFNPEASKNKVFVDIYELKVNSATANQITATCPASLPRGTFKICVRTGGYRRFSTGDITVNSAWLRIPAPAILTQTQGSNYYGKSNYAGALKNFGYVVSPAMLATYKFNPTDHSWEKLSISFPFWQNLVGAGSTVLGDTLYLVGGYSSNGSAMHAFDPSGNKWRSLGTLNWQKGVLFGLGKSLWFGLDFSSLYANKFWEINTENKYSVNQRGDFPPPVSAVFASYFSIGSKGYVILSDNQVWQFDPAGPSWTRKNNFPGQQRVMATSFVIGDFAYFGAGSNSYNSQAYNDIWKYDPLADSWSLATRIPIERYSAIAFTINNKAYIGFGSKSGADLKDFYEYDPAY